MKKLTELIGKPVLNLYESKIQGTIKDVLFDKNFKKLKYFVIFEDTDNDLNEEKILKSRDIYNIGQNAVVIKNGGYLEVKTIIIDEKTNPINNDCYNSSGDYLGKVVDVLLDDNFFIEQILLDNNERINVAEIITNGDNVLLVQNKDKVVKLFSFKSRAIKNNEENKKILVEILNNEKVDETTEDETQEIEQDIEQNNSFKPLEQTNEDNENKIEPIKPKKKLILTNLNLPLTKATKDNYLIGRKVTQNIYSSNHELVIRKNTRITEKTIVTAKMYSVIKELSVYSE